MTVPERRTTPERLAFLDGYAAAIRAVEGSGIEIARACLASGRESEIRVALDRVRERDGRLAAAGRKVARGLRRAATPRAKEADDAR
jgi:hypothetical protein